MYLCLPLAAQMHRYSLGFTVTFNAQNSKLNAQSSMLNATFTDTLQIEFDNHRILLPVEIEGKKYRFLFDTGATQGAVFNPSPLYGKKG